MSNSLDKPEDFNISMPLSPAVAIMLATQFTREDVVRSQATYAIKPEPMFVAGPGEPTIAVNFLKGLEEDRLELRGPGDSALILDVLGQLAHFDDTDVLMNDVGHFANEALRNRWYSLPSRDPGLIDIELKKLVDIAAMLFERVCAPNDRDRPAEAQ